MFNTGLFGRFGHALHMMALSPSNFALYLRTGYFPVDRFRLERLLIEGCQSSVRAQIGDDLKFMHRRLSNANYDIHTNGEAWLISKVLNERTNPVVFDVGANHGDWTYQVLRSAPTSQVECFEINEETAGALRRRFEGIANVRAHACGLSDTEERVRLKCYNNDTLNSVLDYPHSSPFEWREAPVTTGDNFCDGEKINRIDLLKIDVEGLESNVLLGLKARVANGSIKVIQFEYGKANIYTKFLLKDFYDLLTPFSFRIGKLHPSFVNFKDYEPEDEDFLGPNFVASAPHLVNLLSRID